MERSTRPELTEWFERLSNRLKGTVVLNRSWESALSNTMLVRSKTGPMPLVGVFMDPPYVDTDMYSENSDSVARASYDWAVEHGNDYRIAYCSYEGSFDWPNDWTIKSRSVRGAIRDGTRKKIDTVAYSPMCIT